MDLAKMSLEEKVGQLLMVGFHGKEVSPELENLLRERHVGGVIIFYRNIHHGPHLATLTGQIQGVAPRPLLLSADQEGGSVLRVRTGATLLPSAMGSGRLDPECTRELGAICGREMRAMGLNLNLAPCLEINTWNNPGIGIRAFGEDPDRVAAHGVAYVRGIQSTGVMATVKHFPGKGLARLDAHLDLPVIDRTARELDDWELVPFKSAFAAGAAAAMTSHCVYPALDPLPATLSRKILTDLLRTELGFGGILITDDMEMGAILKYREGPRAALAAFSAGADVLLVCADHDFQNRLLDELITGFQKGDLSTDRLEESLKRIAKVKERICAPEGNIEGLVAQHRPALDRAVAEMIRIVRDPKSHIPIKAGRTCHVFWPDLASLTRVEEGTEGPERLTGELQKRFDKLVWHTYDPRQGGSIEGDSLDGSDLVLFFSANAHLFEKQQELLNRVASRRGPFVLVALRNPYDTDLLPEASAVATYGFLPPSIEALTARLLGR